MIRNLFCPNLIETGPVSDGLMVVRDGWVNFFILKSPAGLVCIDAGGSASGVSRGFELLGLEREQVVAVLVTHLHWDHAQGLSLFPQAEVYVGEKEVTPFYMRSRKVKNLKRVNGDRTIHVGGLDVRVLDTPGHTVGSVSYVIGGGLLFTGDTLRLRGGIVYPFRSCFNRENRVLPQSIRKLARLNGVECLLTAHHGISRDMQVAFGPWMPQSGDAGVGGVGS